MMSPYLASCTSCGSKATQNCAGCLEAPEYHPGDSVSVFYCGRDCQKKHWPSHKPRCTAMRQRRKLFRAALVLKAALLTYREGCYDVPLTKIELRDGVLHLHQRPRGIAAPCIRGPFPDHLTTNTKHKEAALAVNQCTTAMALLSGLTRKLLAGVASTIEILDLHLGRQPIPTKLLPGPDATTCPHTVLKVGRLFASETWIIDTTGCQYGFEEVLVPFDKYIEERECRSLGGPETYIATETKDLDYFATLSFMNRLRTQRENLKRERQSRLRFAEFVDTAVSQDILEGSNADFNDNLNTLMSQLALHMLKPARRHRLES
ncbi:hypothetical protein BJX70DRAFT_49020 [Aspergillus crustosus]